MAWHRSFVLVLLAACALFAPAAAIVRDFDVRWKKLGSVDDLFERPYKDLINSMELEDGAYVKLDVFDATPSTETAHVVFLSIDTWRDLKKSVDVSGDYLCYAPAALRLVLRNGETAQLKSSILKEDAYTVKLVYCRGENLDDRRVTGRLTIRNPNVGGRMRHLGLEEVGFFWTWMALATTYVAITIGSFVIFFYFSYRGELSYLHVAFVLTMLLKAGHAITSVLFWTQYGVGGNDGYPMYAISETFSMLADCGFLSISLSLALGWTTLSNSWEHVNKLPGIVGFASYVGISSARVACAPRIASIEEDANKWCTALLIGEVGTWALIMLAIVVMLNLTIHNLDTYLAHGFTTWKAASDPSHFYDTRRRLAHLRMCIVLILIAPTVILIVTTAALFLGDGHVGRGASYLQTGMYELFLAYIYCSVLLMWRPRADTRGVYWDREPFSRLRDAVLAGDPLTRPRTTMSFRKKVKTLVSNATHAVTRHSRENSGARAARASGPLTTAAAATL